MRSWLLAVLLTWMMVAGCDRGTGPSTQPGQKLGLEKGKQPVAEDEPKSETPGKKIEQPATKADLTAVEFQVKPTGVNLESFPVPDGHELNWVISVPKRYSPKAPVPLVVALHYSGKKDKWYGNGLVDGLIGPGFADLEAIIVAPDIVEGDDWASATNTDYVLFLTRSMLKTYAIDPKKVVLTGYSAGAMGTWAIAAKHQDLFTAAIPIAGKPVGADPAQWHLPVYALNSDKDATFPVAATREFLDKVKFKEPPPHLEVVPGLGHFDVAGYVAPLKKAVDWLKETWKAKEPATKG